MNYSKGSTLGVLEKRYNASRKLAEDGTKEALQKAKNMKKGSRVADPITINPDKPDLTARPIN